MVSPVSIYQWEPWLVKYLPTEGDLGLDIGAHIGIHLRYMTEAFAEVWAYEPEPRGFNLMNKVVSENNWDNVLTFDTAFSNTEGEFILYSHKDREDWATMFYDLEEIRKGWGDLIETNVKCLTLDSLDYGTHSLDFIKIDTEGAECAILSGGINTLKTHMPALIIEAHGLDRRDECLSILSNIGYDNPVECDTGSPAIKHLCYQKGGLPWR